MIVAGADDIVAMLEESQVTVGTIRGSRYVGPIKVTIQLTGVQLLVYRSHLLHCCWLTSAGCCVVSRVLCL